jgi:hypothetical protein
MPQPAVGRKPIVDWLTVVVIAAIAISLTVASHEGAHALTCLAVGGNLQEYSALYAECNSPTEAQAKIVAGSAPIYNLIAGFVLWIILHKSRKQAPETWLFLWLFMLMNWYYCAGYLIFSGIANIGDWAVVIKGWEPNWLWRVLMTILGTLFYMVFVRLALGELGKMIGGEADEQIDRANKLCFSSYITAFVVVLLAGFFCPKGLFSLPVTAGLFGVLGALSPFLFMTRWFRTEHFVKLAREPLEIHRKWQWLVTAVIVVFTYIFILGQTLYF